LIYPQLNFSLSTFACFLVNSLVVLALPHTDAATKCS